MAKQQQKLKGLPKRTGNARRISRRAESWKRGQEKKALRKEMQKEAETRNKKLRVEGKLTPWEESKKRRNDVRNV